MSLTNGINDHHRSGSTGTVGGLVQNVLKSLDGIDSSSFESDGDRMDAVNALYNLVARLETPWDFLCRIGMGQPALGSSLKIGKDLDLYEKWHAAGGGPMTSEQLAALVGCDPVLFERIIRHLASNHMIDEPEIGLFQPNKYTISFLNPSFGEWINHLYDATWPLNLKLPEYLAQRGYKNPSDPRDGVFQYAKNCTGLDCFGYFDQNPREGNSFNHVMGGVMANQAGWLEIFPHEELLRSAKPDSSPILVDVGGSIGHDIERFRRVHPECASRLYLQDRADVVKLSKCPDPVNKVAYDFFTPQSITGARAYYMHGVLHDWPDKEARRILAMQRLAMTPGYSTLLIHDHITPREKAHQHTTAYDLTMMVMLAGEERSEDKWIALLESEGFELVKIWRSPLTVQGVIEARVKVAGSVGGEGTATANA